MKRVVPAAPIAIVGAAALFPGSIDKDGFWRDILAGKDLISDVPPSHWLIEDYYDPDPRARDKTYARRGAFLPSVSFDPLEWGIPPSNVPATDTNQLLALIVAQQVLQDAAGDRFKDMPRDRISVILGCTSAQELLGSMVSRLQRPVWVKALREQGLSEDAVNEACDRIASHYVEWQESTFPGVLGNVVAGRIANRLNLGGTNCVTDAACASSLSAVAMAVSELRLGDSDLVITGGADTMNDIFMYVCFSKTPALSPTGDCRPFSDAADGTMLGEGLGMVALKRLEDAERDGDRIYAVIKGIGSSSDGRSKSVYAPVPAGQAAALRRAYDQAGYGPETVTLVEAHGTGTRAGDAAEFEGLRQVFGEAGGEARGWCALGSVKSQVGHTKAAAGAAGLFKVTMALAHKVLPPTIKVERPDPKLAIDDSPFYLNTTTRPWISDGRHPRRASVSSFGFGGSNFHVALEEYVGPAPHPPRIRPVGVEAVLFADESGTAIAERCRALVPAMDRPGMLAYLARTTQASFVASAPARLAIFAESEADLATKLEKAAEVAARGQAFTMPGVLAFATSAATGDVGFVFPGQGSQFLHMTGDVAATYERAREVWDRARAIELTGGRPYLDEVAHPPGAFDDAARAAQVARLTTTEWAQPAIGAASLSLLALLGRLGLAPAAVAGHSFGELTALCAAGALSPDDFLRAARRRGELMAEAAAIPGAMTSVAGRVEDLQQVLAASGLGVAIANYNTPAQVVLSGTVDDITAIEKRLAEAGLQCTRLPVSTAFHSPIVSAASVPFREFLGGLALRAPAVDVYGTASAAPYPTEPEAMRDILGRQLTEPVRFVEQIEAMYARGVRTFVEVGPGTVLTNMIGHILKARPHHAIALNRKGRAGLACLHEGLGLLSVAGMPLDYAHLWSDFAATPDPRARTKPPMAIELNGAGYGKPYPPPRGAADLPPPNLHASPPLPPPAPERIEVPMTPPPIHPEAPEAHDAHDAHDAHAYELSPYDEPVEHRAGRYDGDPDIALAWIQAFQETQRHTAEAHAGFQRALAEGHAAFLRSAEHSVNGLAAILTGTPLAAPPPIVAAPPIAPVAIDPPPPRPRPALTPPVTRMAPVARAPARAPAPPPVTMAAPAPAAPTVVRVAAAPPPPPTPAKPTAARPAAAMSTEELQALALGAVAARTGYPQEMLGLDMDLEADLGVDSIKRVEILAALAEKAPSLPEVTGAEMASKRTLRQILAHFMSLLSGREPDPPAGGGGGGDGRARGPTNGSAAASHRDHGAASSGNGAPVASAAPAHLERHVVRAVSQAAAGLGVPGLVGATRLVITDDGEGVASALAARFAAAGTAASVVEQVPSDADAVIFLGPRAGPDPAASLAVHRAALAAARAVAPRFETQGGTFVTVQDTGGDFGQTGSEAGWLAGLAGLTKTAVLEWPLAHVRALDVERGGHSSAAVAETIWNELLEGGEHTEIGLGADGRRIVLATEPVTLPPAGAGPRVDPGAVVLASGGARGVTAACLIALAEARRCRFVLLGRTALVDEPEACRGITGDAELKRVLLAEAQRRGEPVTPAALGRSAAAVRAAREVRHTIDAIRKAGGEARYEAVDVTDAAAVARVVAEVRTSWGPIAGVVHGAGVLADKRIASMTDAQFEAVFATKVLGLHALLAATRDDDLAFVALFSSIAARFGNAGQAAYAMANEVLNKVAALEQRRRGARCLVRAIGWGPWDGGMVDDGLRAHFAARGVPLIPIAAGAHQFCAELAAAGDGGGTEIVVGSFGASAAQRAAPSEQVRDVVVGPARHGFLDGHRIKGVPVVPIALVLEWFARAAAAESAGGALTIRDLRVLRGVRLDGFDAGRAAHLRVRMQPLDGASRALELIGATGVRHYTAVVELARPPAAPVPSLGALAPWSGDVYGRHALFHGPSFHVIAGVDGVSARGMSATLVGCRDRGWPGAWQLDPAILDGGLQLALMWTRHRLDGTALPTAIGSLRVHAAGPARGPVRCLLEGRDARGDRAVSDITFVDEQGTVIAVLAAVETHVLPGEASGEPYPRDATAGAA